MKEQQREEHKAEVESYFRARFGGEDWNLELPRGSGQETYIAKNEGRRLFVKLGVDVGRVRAMAEAGITPAVVEAGELKDGTVFVVQEWVEGRRPDRVDYAERLEDVARIMGEMHRSDAIKKALPAVAWSEFGEAGLRALKQARGRWDAVKEQVGEMAHAVDESLDELEERMRRFEGEGLVASHNDISWDNWLFDKGGRIYIVDPDMMGLDDPALDVGITLWWYYAPELWGRFIECAGYIDDEGFRERMWARIALHCLRILLPRPGSFDRFDAEGFWEASEDFRAALGRKGNPQM